MTRKEANYKILDRIAKYVDQNPDIRFHQALQNLHLENAIDDKFSSRDLFYEESETTFNNMREI